MSAAVTLAIERLGQRGEGVAAGPVYVPDALPGERVLAMVDGDRGTRLDILIASPDRRPPICPYFGTCGGCAVQSLAEAPYAAWKRELVVTALSMAGVAVTVLPLVDAHGEGRRRATFHARAAAGPNVLADRPPVVGYMRARAHDIVEIAACPILSPRLEGALPAARALAAALRGTGKPLDILVTASDEGLDIDVRGCGPLDAAATARAVAAADAHDLARLSNHGEVLIGRRPASVVMGRATVSIPPKAFLQATARGEEVLAAAVREGVGPARRVLDLFAGVGTFSLRLAEAATVHAADGDPAALAALAQAAGAARGVLHPVTVEMRDLFRRPVGAAELAAFDAVVFDPPWAGAAAQAAALAASGVPTVVAVSCHPASFARDAATLLAGGYRLDPVLPVDQFRYAAHVELVAVFRRPPPASKRRRSLFG